DGKEVKRLKGFEGAPVFSPDGKLLAVSGAKNGILVIDVATGQVLSHFEPAGIHIGFYSDLAFSPDSKLLASGSRESLRVWEAVGGQEKLNIQMPDRKEVRGAIAFSPDGNVLATANDHVIRRWDA